MKIRLLSNHPVVQKLEQIFELMEKLGVTIEIGDNIITVKTNGVEYQMYDNELNIARANHSQIDQLPPKLEYKIIGDKNETTYIMDVSDKDDIDIQSIKEFKEACAMGSFIDSDGFGYPVKDGMANPSICITPSELHKIPENATHILWYNQ